MLAPPPSLPADEVVRRIEGWEVHIERRILTERPRLWEAAQGEMRREFERIERVVPDDPLAKLKTVRIWVHLDNPANAGAAFHPDRGWLVEHGQDPRMARGIEIGNLEHFVAWTYDQPWMLMHELAHAYHFGTLPSGAENADVKAAYDEAVASHRYEGVLRASGRTERAYALTNPMEYFAETTEAYFGQNDFYPFVRAELQTFDPKADALMRKIWGEPVVRTPKG